MNEDMIAKTMKYRTLDNKSGKWEQRRLATAAQVHLYNTYEVGSCGLAMNDRHPTIYSNYFGTNSSLAEVMILPNRSEQVHCKQQDSGHDYTASSK